MGIECLLSKYIHRKFWYLFFFLIYKCVLTATFLRSLWSLKNLQRLCSGPCFQEKCMVRLFRWCHCLPSFWSCQHLYVSVAPNCERQPKYKEAPDSILFTALFRYCISFGKICLFLWWLNLWEQILRVYISPAFFFFFQNNWEI